MSLLTSFNKRKSAPALPLMPLIDIIFLILIFFVINVNLPPGGIEIDLPSATAQRTTQEADEVIISLSGQGDIFLNNDREILTKEQLGSVLQAYRGKKGGQFFRLRADRRLEYGQVIAVLDMLAQVSANISLETIADVSPP